MSLKRFFPRIGITVLILFALLAISFTVWRVNLARDVNAKLEAIRAAGLPTSGAELNAYYPAVPDNENAALVMTQAFALMRNYVVYSVGADGHDDGGREKPADWKSSDKTPYDITFTVER
jgi:hypothetical protein